MFSQRSPLWSDQPEPEHHGCLVKATVNLFADRVDAPRHCAQRAMLNIRDLELTHVRVYAVLRRSSSSRKLGRHKVVPCGPRERFVEELLNTWQRLKLLPDASVLNLVLLRVGLVDQLIRARGVRRLAYSRCKPSLLSMVSRWTAS